MREIDFLAHKRRQISKLASELVPAAGCRIEWVSPLVGRFALKNITNEIVPARNKFRPPYFELNAVFTGDTETGQYPASRTTITGSGLIAGVLHGSIDMYMANWDEVDCSMRFQLDNRLTAPTRDDYDELARYLRLGIMDNVVVRK